MSDKMEREIEEILARLDTDAPNAPEPAPPISIMARRKKAARRLAPERSGSGGMLARVNPTAFLFTGAGVMVAGLVLSNVWQPFIWASFAGVVLFIGGFLWSFRRSPGPHGAGAAPPPKGHYWRDRYIEYEPAAPGPMDRLKRRLRRR